MDNPLQGAIQKMGSNFLVAAFIPAMAFILLSALSFFPVLPDELAKYLGWSITNPQPTTVVTALLFTTILGFTLFTLSTYIYKSFEGYTFILKYNTPIRRSFIRRQRKRIRKLEIEKLGIEKELNKINKIIEKEEAYWRERPWLRRRLNRYKARQRYLKDRKYALVAFSDGNFPPSEHLVLPTRFGNILRAAENYPVTRYKIDAVPIWGRMAHVMPPEAMEKIDQANNQCLFLLNSSLLAGVFSVISLLAALYLIFIMWAKVNNPNLLLTFMNTQLNTNVGIERAGIYIFLTVVSGIVAWFFYEASLLNVSQYGSMIKTSYDLYRFNLLEKLNLPLPKNLEGERTLWQQVSEFMIGNDSFGKVTFSYFYYSNLDFKPKTQPEDASLEEFFNSN